MRCLLLIFLLMMMQTAEPVAAQQAAPVLQHWKLAADLTHAGAAAAAQGVAGPITGVYDNCLLVAGGANFPEGMPWLGGKKVYQQRVYIYAIQKNAELLLERTGLLPEPLAYAAVCSTADGIVVAGGESAKGWSKTCWLLSLSATGQLQTTALPDLPVATTNAAACTDDRYVYVGGGETTAGTTAAMYRLDLQAPAKGWTSWIALPQPLSHFVLLHRKQQGKHVLFAAAGRYKKSNGLSAFSSKLYCMDVTSKAWTSLADMPVALSAGTAVDTKDGLMLFGGDTGETFYQVEALIQTIASTSDTAHAAQLNAQKIALQSQHPGFHSQVYHYHVDSNTWSEAGRLPYATPVTTTAVPWHQWVFIPSGEIKAGVRSPYIISVKLQHP